MSMTIRKKRKAAPSEKGAPKGIAVFVSFHWNKGDLEGFSDSSVFVSAPLASAGDLAAVREFIKQQTGSDSITILYWRRFEESTNAIEEPTAPPTDPA